MQCTKCKCELTFDITTVNSDCIFCGGKVTPTAAEFLGQTELGLVQEIRDNQVKLGKLISDSFRDNCPAIAEAGTGIGKSFAYLVPAICAGRHVVVSTAKKSLQSQLIEKDLPLLREKLGIDFKFAQAYGKSNYACAARVNKKSNKTLFQGKLASEFFTKSEHALWSEAPDVLKGRSLKVIQTVSRGFTDLNAENCTGSKCALHSMCKYIADKKAVEAANIVVSNHWLTGYDILLRQEEGIELLGKYDTLIVDEAHKFEDGVRTAFTQEIRETALSEMQSVLDAANEIVPSFAGEFPYKVKELRSAWSQFFSATGNDLDITSHAFRKAKTELSACIELNFSRISDSGYLKDTLVCAMSDAAIASTMMRKTTSATLTSSTGGLNEEQTTIFIALKTVATKLQEILKALSKIDNAVDNQVTYLETNGRYKAIKTAPINVANILKPYYSKLSSTVYLSATLAIQGNLDHFKNRLGLNGVNEGIYGSTFNYDKQALLYISRSVTKPDATDYIERLANEIQDLVLASSGNAFVLFTAKSEMHAVAERLQRNYFPLPLLVQDGPAGELLKQYRKEDSAVLFGLKSFWEGVDVQGDKLQLVIIAKLPFPLRSDPIIMARCAKAESQWFNKVYIPEMILDLRQGVGRLIRSKTDRGVVALLDARLESGKYKKKVLNSLEFTQVTVNKTAVLNALQNLAAQR